MTKLVNIGEYKRNMIDYHNAINPNFIIPSNADRKLKLFDIKNMNSVSDIQIDESSYVSDLRKAAEVHKTVRRRIQEYLKPNVKIIDICNKIENDIVEIFGQNNLKSGIAFPTGVSLNNCVCHDSANYNDTRTFGYDDVCKIDFGTHINGHIIDCAFTAAFNPEYEELLEASKQGTYEAIKMARPDALIYDISKTIKEVIESHEVTIKNKTYEIKAVKDLGGHSIEPYIIHAGQIILCTPIESKEYKTDRIKENCQYAIETFASTGTGKLNQIVNRPSNHFMLNKDFTGTYNSKLKTFNTVYNWIKKNRSTLAFCPRWMEQQQIKGVDMSLKDLSRKNNPPVVIEYPPLDDIDGSLVSHFEHTLYVHENGTEVFTFDDDY